MSDYDPTEGVRRELVREINENPLPRELLEVKYGPDNVWDTDELRRDFEVTGFMAPFVVVVRKSDGKRGTLTFEHSPRFYFDWKEDIKR